MNHNEDNLYFDADLISLLDDDGNEYEFEILDEIDHRDGHFMVLMPLFDLPEDTPERSIRKSLYRMLSHLWAVYIYGYEYNEKLKIILIFIKKLLIFLKRYTIIYLTQADIFV